VRENSNQRTIEEGGVSAQLILYNHHVVFPAQQEESLLLL